MRIVGLIGCALLVSACTKTANMYPMNLAPGEAVSVIKAKYKSYGIGHGSIAVTMPDGETLQGEYNVIDNTSLSFGSIYGSVYGSNGYAYASGGGMSVNTPGAQHGEAVLIGDRGTTMQCEMVVSSWTGRGSGACKSSKGTIYKVMF